MGSPTHNPELPGLLRTKLYRPPATPDLEQRARLTQRLDHHRKRPLTLISAPAGYGKTMLASMWLASCDCPSAWVSLDEADNDLRTFASYLLAAVRTAFPGLELKTQALLDASTLSPVPVLARYLLNDLDQIVEPFILALDDVHLIQEQAIHDLLSELLRHPPSCVHLVLIGRRDPNLNITSLRARSQVTEIRTWDLRFTPQETARLLGQWLNRDIDAAIAAEWTHKTEGWVTALRLAALSLRHRDRADDLHVDFQGDSRYLHSYLLAEVLARLPVAQQAWLLMIAVLDRFCAPLCEAVCQADARMDLDCLSGVEFIDWLQRENLFLVPLDDRGEWFRFHHLFQRLLQDQLKREQGPGDIARLHQRASRWFAGNDLIDEALQHAIAAEDVSYAVHLVEGHRYRLMNTDQWRRLRRWLDLLPPKAVAQDPLLLCAQAFWAIHSATFQVIVSSLQRAQQLLADLDPGYAAREIAQAEIVVIESLLGLAGPQQAETLERCRSTLGVLPRSALHIRSLAIFIIALSRQMMGDIEGAIATIREELAEQPWSGAYRARMMHYLCIVHIQEGDLLGVLSTAPIGLKIAKKPLATEPLNWCRYDLGMAHYLRGEFEQAEPYLLALLEDRYAAPSGYLTQGGFVLALLYLCQDRNTEAAQIIDFLEATFQETKESQALAMTAAIQVEVALREGRLPEAHTLSQSIEFDLIPPHWFLYVPQLTPIKLLLAEKSPRSLQEARARLEVLDENMRELNRKNVLIDVLALQALVYDALGEKPAAFEKLRAALGLGEPGGFIRTFVDLGAPMAALLLRLQDQEAGKDYTDYIHRILAAFPDGARPAKESESAPTGLGYQPPDGSLIDSLTRRELQVLKLLATDLSPGEIAAKLVISPGTVRTHTKNIYRKLDVGNRIQAVQRARDSGLV